MLIFLGRILNQLVQGYVKPSKIVKAKPGVLQYNVNFRCWPIDIDMFMHMNNAMYVRVAELARWRIFIQSGTLQLTTLRGILFLAVEQKVTYQKPISPFQAFTVSTTLSHSDNKWLYYTHTFQSDEGKKEPKVYAVVECKAVLKEKTGKTVYISDLVKESDFYKQLLDD